MSPGDHRAHGTTAPVAVPFRAMMTAIPLSQYLLAGVLSNGKRPTMKELMRWLRTA